MARALLLAFTFLASPTAFAWSLQCALGMTKCVKSQGTEIPSKEAITILDLCDEFTNRDIGRVALKLSFEDLQNKTGGKLSPLSAAWFAYGDLYDSPLSFERASKAEEADYSAIKRSCVQLKQDFNTSGLWVN